MKLDEIDKLHAATNEIINALKPLDDQAKARVIAIARIFYRLGEIDDFADMDTRVGEQ